MTLSKKAKDIYLVGGGFSEEALLVFGLMSTELSAPLKKIVNRFVNSQVASGNWALLGQLLVVLDTQANSLTDWLGNQNGLAVNSPVFDAFDSWTFDRSTNYINCQLAATAMPNTSLNDNEIGAWVVSHSVVTTEVLIGSRVTGSRETILGATTTVVRGKTNSGSFTSFTSAFNANSLYSTFRLDSADQHLYKNGIEIAKTAVVSNAEPNQDYFWGARNASGTAGQHFGGSSSLFYAGSGNIDTLNLFTNMNIMITAIAALG